MSKSDCATAADVTPQTLDNWVRKGRIMERGRGEWHVQELLQELDALTALEAITRPGRELAEVVEEEGRVLDLNLERARLAHYQANHQELSYTVAQRELAPTAMVLRVVEGMFMLVRSHFLSLPQKVVDSVRAADSAEEARNIMQHEIHQILAALSEEDVERTIGGSDRTPGYAGGGGVSAPRLSTPSGARQSLHEIDGATYTAHGQRVGRPSSDD